MVYSQQSTVNGRWFIEKDSPLRGESFFFVIFF